MDRILYLVFQYRTGEITDAESQELADWIDQSIDNKLEFERLTDPVGTKHELEFRKRMEAHMRDVATPRAVTIWLSWGKWAAAAVLLIGIATVALWNTLPAKKDMMVQTPAAGSHSDVEPGKFQAVLRLADGRNIVLDSAGVGQLGQQGPATIYNEKGQLKYNVKDAPGDALIFNKLETATGQTYALTLSDGTQVWLNSKSSIRFPVNFGEKERRVEMQGEVFFDVAKNAKKPFKVTVNTPGGKGSEIEVLGTQFNINAYEDEAYVRATLIEGKVAINRNGSTTDHAVLKPGQQASLKPSGTELNVVNTEAVIAWKDQTFYFESYDLGTIMRQLARWYGITVVYQGEVKNRQFGGMVSRNRTLSEVLKALELNQVRFKVEGKTVVVMP
jgi:transmembrane sensor